VTEFGNLDSFLMFNYKLDAPSKLLRTQSVYFGRH